ncbi:MAG: bifunctional oligoribonuclease/PAP phosphatase NrnA [Sumerlaeia bacterium]
MGKTANVQDIAKLLKVHQSILVVSHQRPDGDCFGSATALLRGLQLMGKQVAGYNASGVSEKLKFIPFTDLISDQLPEWTADVTVFVDCGNAKRVAPDFVPQGTTINIDHHISNDCFGDYNYIDANACAVGEQILHLLGALDIPISSSIANSLFASVSSDTGSFRYSNTNAHSFEIGRILVEKGANPGWVCEQLFESKTREEVQLQARAMNNIRYECEGRLSWSELRWADYVAAGGAQHEPEGLSTELRSIIGVEISLLFHETEDGGLRCSLRSKGRVDCNKIAGAFGGGGHANAAGYKSKGKPYEQHRDEIIAAAMVAVNEIFSV